MLRLGVVLYNIRSLHNVGSIFRTADAAGVEKVFLTGTTPTPTDRLGKKRPQITKVALGAENNVSWEKAEALNPLIRLLKKDGWKIVAVEQSKLSRPYHLFSRHQSGKIILIFGSETRGLTTSKLKLADVILEIPMCGRKESLNVSVAAGIVLYRLRFPTA